MNNSPTPTPERNPLDWPEPEKIHSKDCTCDNCRTFYATPESRLREEFYKFTEMEKLLNDPLVTAAIKVSADWWLSKLSKFSQEREELAGEITGLKKVEFTETTTYSEVQQEHAWYNDGINAVLALLKSKN